jgi:hypothetical protein
VTRSDFVITIGKWPRLKGKYLHREWTKTKKPAETEVKQDYKYSNPSGRSGYSKQEIYRPDDLPRNAEWSFQNTSGKIEKKICRDRPLPDFQSSLSRLEIFVHPLSLSDLNT